MPAGVFNALWVELRAISPWRIGPDSGDRDRVDHIYHSDSLYSAISGAMASLGILEDWLEATARAEDPAVRFSSCFPLLDDHKFVVPPRSLWPPPASAKVRWKGAEFVPLGVVGDLIHGRPVNEETWTVDGASQCLVPHGAPGPFRISVRSTAAIDRMGYGVEPHSCACLEFAPNAGLWMVAAFRDDESGARWKGPVRSALRLLADSGFGGERSNGWGRAEIAISDRQSTLFPLPEVPGETAWWMLSLFHPASSDAVDWQRGSYSLTTRGGRVEHRGDPKKPTRMVAEGSVIVAPAEPRGAATDVAPADFSHPVYRAGFALAIPIPLIPAPRPA